MHITDKQRYIAIGVIVIIIVWLLFFHHKPKPVHAIPNNEIIKAAIDSAIVPIQKRNDSLLRENDSLHRLYDGTQQRNRDLLSLISKEHNARFTLKKLYDEKISAVDKFTPADIDSFITNRYLHKQRR